MSRTLIALVLMMSACLIPRLADAQSSTAQNPVDPVEQLAKWTDDATFLVITVDLATADPSILLTDFANELRTRVDGGAGGGAPTETLAATEQLAASLKSWRSDFVAAGGRELWGIASLSDIASGMGGPSKPLILVVPLGDPGNVDALTKVIERIPDVGTRVQREGNFLVAGTLTRVGQAPAATAEVGMGEAPASASPRLPLTTPTRAAELRGALAQTGSGSIRILFIPADYIRRAFEEMSPTLPSQLGGEPMTTVTQGVQSLAGAIAVSPEAKLTMSAKSLSVVAAQKFAGFLDKLFEALAADKRAAAAIPEFAKVLATLKPKVSGDRLTWSLDQAEMRTTMGRLLPTFLAARGEAQSKQLASQIRQVLMGCWIHSSQNKDQWPEDLNALITSGILAEEFREILPKLVHLKPTAEAIRARPAETPAIYEKFDAWPATGVWVGFADGHVSKVADEAAFKALLVPPAAVPAKP